MVEKNRRALSSNVDKNGLLRKRKSQSESGDDLCGIDDAEITGYLNNKSEMFFKKLVWEAMNKDYPKKQRKPTMGKKSTAEKAVISRMEKGKEEEKVNRKRMCSKINYDALEKLTDEPGEVTEKAQRGGIDSNCSNQIEAQQSKGTSSVQGFQEDDHSEEFQLDNANIFQEDNYSANLWSYGDEEDYDHEEF
ncbi:hypothetical protein DITRI_Ditri02bG0064700 [Diplodiscus trichospermus]